MNRDQARRLLNKLQEGEPFEYEQITAALIATGDLAGWRRTHLVGSLAASVRGEGMGQAVQRTSKAKGQQICSNVVEADQGTFAEDTWPGWSKYLDR